MNPSYWKISTNNLDDSRTPGLTSDPEHIYKQYLNKKIAGFGKAENGAEEQLCVILLILINNFGVSADTHPSLHVEIHLSLLSSIKIPP